MASDQNRFPRLTDGLDLRSLPIGPAEAFVLSHVDGHSSATEIAAAVGLDADAVEATLSRLGELGAVHFEERQAATRAPRVAPAASGQYALGSIVEEPGAPGAHPGAKLYDAAELEEAVEIEPARRQQILDTFYKLDRLTHYELLGLDASTDRRAIKARYYEVVNVFHPDRYYGKKLGSYKAKLERVFQRVTEAHEVLARPEARAEYDAYLKAERRNEALDRKLNDEAAYARELEAVQARIEAEARAAAAASAAAQPREREAAIARSSAVPLRPSAAPPISPARPSSSSGEARVHVPASDPDARRRALARKLGLTPPPPGRVEAAPAVSTQATQERAAEDLKRRYEQRMREAQRRQAEAYAARADQAIAANNVVDAVNALRIAASLAPDNGALKSRLVELERAAARELADRYREQAAYEEREKRWADAARSYERVLARAPNPQLSERFAHCLLNSQGDVKKAVEHARIAVLDSPNDARFRITLARAYLAAKMKESAMGELERASALAPSDDSIREQIRRLKRGEF